MNAVLAIAATELTIARRNRLVAVAVALMALFALALTALGSEPTGALGVDLLTAAAASLTTLTVYLVPLIALLQAFDAVAGEVERGALALTFSYPAPRAALLAGKFLAHLATLALAVAVGFGVAGGLAAMLGGASAGGWVALARLGASAVALGATFLGAGYAISCLARQQGVAAGLAVGAWLVLVVLYDLGLLAALIADDGGAFTRTVFPWLLIANPADAFRLVNLPQGEAAALASGFAPAGAGGPLALASLLLWPLAALALAWAAFRRVEP